MVQPLNSFDLYLAMNSMHIDMNKIGIFLQWKNIIFSLVTDTN